MFAESGFINSFNIFVACSVFETVVDLESWEAPQAWLWEKKRLHKEEQPRREIPKRQMEVSERQLQIDDDPIVLEISNPVIEK